MSLVLLYWQTCAAACVAGMLACLHINRMNRQTPHCERLGAVLVAAGCFAKSVQWVWGDYTVTVAAVLMFNGGALFAIALSHQRLIDLGRNTGRFFGRRVSDRRAAS